MSMPQQRRWHWQRHLRHLVLAACFFALAGSGQAACDSGLAGRMRTKLHPDRAFDEALAACRVWPGVPGRSIVVLPLPHPSVGDSGATEYDLDILVVQQADNGNTERAVVAGRLTDVNALFEGLLRIQDIRIDTTRYPLASGSDAFGVRVRYRSLAQTRPYAEETLTLYLVQGDRLRKVLDATQVSVDRGEWDGTCVGSFERMRATASIGAPAHRPAMADLMLQATRTSSRASFIDGDCIEQVVATTVENQRLHFDGKRYLPR